MSRFQATERPNVVYILADDMGYGDLSCLNAESKIQTQNLDRIAAAGMRFTDAHSSSAVCTPSRYSVLTGRYNWRSSLKKGVFSGYSAHALIEPGRMTVASFLRDNGYHTACVGKWHLGWTWPLNSADPQDIDFSAPIPDGPTTRGFDWFHGIVASLDFPPYVYVDNDRPTSLPDRVTKGEGKAFWREGPTGADFEHEDVLPHFTGKACEYIRERAATEQPFFLYFPLPSPHTPILPTKRFAGKSGTNEYGDFCLLTDWCVGEIMRTLEDEGLAENTILVFTADNGCSPMADFEELAAVGHHPSYLFRGHKADIFEGGHRIPLLVRWPERIAAGTVSDETVCLSDMLATVADILGAPLPEGAGEDSVSNLPAWLGQATGAPLREATVHHSINGSFSIRQGRWKLEFCPGSGGWSEPKPGPACEGLPLIQLYDLAADIGERRNLQAEFPEIVAELTALMTRYVKTGRSTPGAPQKNTGPAYWPQLSWMLEPETEIDQ